MLFCCLEAQRGQFFRRKTCHIIATLWCIQLKLWKKKKKKDSWFSPQCIVLSFHSSFYELSNVTVLLRKRKYLNYIPKCTHTRTHTDKVCLTPDSSTRFKNCCREKDMFVWRGRKATLLRKVRAATVNISNTSEGTVGAGCSWEMWFST